LTFRDLTIDGGVWVAGTDPLLIQPYKGDHTVPGRTAVRDSIGALGVWAWLGARTGTTIDYADSISFQNVKVLTRGFYVAVAQDFELKDSEVGVMDCGIGAAVWLASFVQFANIESTYIHDTGTPDGGDAHFMVEGVRIGGGGAFNYIFNNYARNMGGPGHCYTVDVGPSWNTFQNNTCEIAQNGFHDQGKPWGNDWIANLARDVRASSFQLVSPGKANENGNSPPSVDTKHVQYKTAFCNESRAGVDTDEDLAAYLVGNSSFFDNYWPEVTVHDTLAVYWGDWGNQWEGTPSVPVSNDTLGFNAHCGPTGSSLPVAGGQGGGQSAPSIPRTPTDLGFTPSRNR
jgi:hypothetical protein